MKKILPKKIPIVKKFRFYPVIIILLLISGFSFGNTLPHKNQAFLSANQAEPIVITGKVVDEKGLPLPGVTVKLKDSNLGIVTLIDGTYSLKLPSAEGTLVFSFIGFTTQELPVGKSRKINVTLKEGANNLNDVVVVGYGQQKKVTVIGAVSTIKAEDLKQPVANLTDVIAGRVAGVIGVQRSGEPGHDNAEIYIRGISTFTNSTPLVLVDGVERDFGNVDPEDIASFSILKDASATAVYGVRGANGVIIIETKKGKVGKPLINSPYALFIMKIEQHVDNS